MPRLRGHLDPAPRATADRSSVLRDRAATERRVLGCRAARFPRPAFRPGPRRAGVDQPRHPGRVPRDLCRMLRKPNMTGREASEHPAPSGVTVVVPVLNEEGAVLSTLDALDHALASSPSAYEIIVVDDGSRDRTPELLAARAGIRVLRHERSRG